MVDGSAAGIPDPATSAPRGTRVRAGNAMGRTRSAVTAGTAQCLVRQGARKTTMIDIAAAAGIAKGTLYNHVRTRSEAYQLLAEAEVGRLVDLLGQGPDVANVLGDAAEFVALHPVIRALAVSEPGSITAVAMPGPFTDVGRARVGAALTALVGERLTPLVFGWLTSLIFDPGSETSRTKVSVDLAALAVLVAGSGSQA